MGEKSRAIEQQAPLHWRRRAPARAGRPAPQIRLYPQISRLRAGPHQFVLLPAAARPDDRELSTDSHPRSARFLCANPHFNLKKTHLGERNLLPN